MSRDTFLPKTLLYEAIICYPFIMESYDQKNHRMISMFVALALEIMNGWLIVKSTLTYHFFMSFENITSHPHQGQYLQILHRLGGRHYAFNS